MNLKQRVEEKIKNYLWSRVEDTIKCAKDCEKHKCHSGMGALFSEMGEHLTTDIFKATELDEGKIKEIITWGGLLPYAKWGNQCIKISEEDKNTIAHTIATEDVYKEKGEKSE